MIFGWGKKKPEIKKQSEKQEQKQEEKSTLFNPVLIKSADKLQEQALEKYGSFVGKVVDFNTAHNAFGNYRGYFEKISDGKIYFSHVTQYRFRTSETMFSSLEGISFIKDAGISLEEQIEFYKNPPKPKKE